MSAPRPFARSYRRLLTQLDGLVALAQRPGELRIASPKVSDWDVGDQLEHALLVEAGVYTYFDRFLAGDASPGVGPSLAGRLILAVGRIPRGRGRSPELFLPNRLDSAALTELAGSTRERFAAFEPGLGSLASSPGRLPHPFLGGFDVAQWLRFLDIHRRHHLKLIAAIRAAADS
ncbi:MAG: hypothetical protein AAGD06_04440 [Acidobacteriota bacterium]